MKNVLVVSCLFGRDRFCLRLATSGAIQVGVQDSSGGTFVITIPASAEVGPSSTGAQYLARALPEIDDPAYLFGGPRRFVCQSD